VVLLQSSSAEHRESQKNGRPPIFSRPPPLPCFALQSTASDLLAPVVTVAPPSPKMFMPPACFAADYSIHLPKSPRSAINNSNALIRRGEEGAEFCDGVDDDATSSVTVVANPLKRPSSSDPQHWKSSLLSPTTFIVPVGGIAPMATTSGLSMKHASSCSWNTSSSPGSLSRWSSSRSSPVVMTSSTSRDASPQARVVIHAASDSAAFDANITHSRVAGNVFAEGATPSCMSPVHGNHNVTSFKRTAVVVLPIAPDSPKNSRSSSMVSKSHVSVLLYGGAEEGCKDDDDDDDADVNGINNSRAVSRSASLHSSLTAGNSTFNLKQQPSSSFNEDPTVLKAKDVIGEERSGDYEDDVCGTNEISISYDDDVVAAQQTAQQGVVTADADDDEFCTKDDETFRHLEASDIVDSDALLGSPETNAELVARVQNAVRHWKPINSGDTFASLGSGDAAAGGPLIARSQHGSSALSTSQCLPANGSTPPLISLSTMNLRTDSNSGIVTGSLTEDALLDGMSYEDLLKWSNEHSRQFDDEACSTKRRRYPRRADGTLILSAIPISARLGGSRVQQHAALMRQCVRDDEEVCCAATPVHLARGCKRRRWFSMVLGSLFAVPSTSATPISSHDALTDSATIKNRSNDDAVSIVPPGMFLSHERSEEGRLRCNDQPHGAQRARRQRRDCAEQLPSAVT
jgi:hypothetical protein